MIDHVLAVAVCWLIAGCGLAMFRYATSPWGRISGHAAMFVSMLSLSAMALDHNHHPDTPPAFAPLLGAIDDVSYHRAGCPLAKREILFRSRDEAEWASKIPCTLCLPHEAQYQVAHHQK